MYVFVCSRVCFLFIGFIESVLVEFNVANSNVVVVGDFNFPCNTDNIGFQAMSGLVKEFNLLCCDELFCGTDTYYNASLNHSSCIDHVFVNAALRSSIESVVVMDVAINQSDHRPIAVQFKFENNWPAGNNMTPYHGSRTSGPRYATRWDKANVNDYYKASYDCLHGLQAEDCFTLCSMGCECIMHRAAIDSMYIEIRCALQQAELCTVPHIPVNGLKPFWNDHLVDLKDKSIFWGNM